MKPNSLAKSYITRRTSPQQSRNNFDSYSGAKIEKEYLLHSLIDYGVFFSPYFQVENIFLHREYQDIV